MYLRNWLDLGHLGGGEGDFKGSKTEDDGLKLFRGLLIQRGLAHRLGIQVRVLVKARESFSRASQSWFRFFADSCATRP